MLEASIKVTPADQSDFTAYSVFKACAFHLNERERGTQSASTKLQ